MKKQDYKKPKLKLFDVRYSPAIALSDPNDGDAGGKGEDFIWGN